jgi:hypothetical protein
LSTALFAADIVASFMLQKTVSQLNESTTKLEFDIYEEIGIPNSTVRHKFCTLTLMILVVSSFALQSILLISNS